MREFQCTSSPHSPWTTLQDGLPGPQGLHEYEDLPSFVMKES